MVPLGLYLMRHVFYARFDMLEILLQSAAKVIQARLAIGSVENTILRTFAMAGKKKFTVPAILRQTVWLSETERSLLS